MTKTDMGVVRSGSDKSGGGNIKPPPGGAAKPGGPASSGGDAARPPRYFYDITADGTHQGKTTIATRLRAHCEDAGLPVTMIRIESAHVARGLREGDVLVPVEAIGQAGKVVGGIAGVMGPALAAVERMIEQGGVVVMDWGGGGVDPVLWTPLKSFSGVSDAAFSKCLSAGVPATDGGVGPIRTNA